MATTKPEVKLGTTEQLKDFLGLGQPEELCLELQIYYELKGPGGCPCIRHPLYYSILHVPQLNRMANEGLKLKKQYLAAKESCGKFSEAIALHERPYRFEALLRYAPQIKYDEQFWDTFGWVWTDSENLWQNARIIRRLLKLNRPGREHMMSEQEREALAKLPAHVQVYRGHDGRNPNGMSWTTDRDSAVWFSTRLLTDGRRGYIASAVVAREQIDAYLLGRNEHEIVLFGGKPKQIELSSKTAREPKTGYERQTRTGNTGKRHRAKAAQKAT